MKGKGPALEEAPKGAGGKGSPPSGRFSLSEKNLRLYTQQTSFNLETEVKTL